MFRGNPLHTGVYSAAGVPKFSKVKWKFHTNGRVFSSPAIANGVAYIGSDDQNLYAVDLETGTLKWRFPTGSRITSSPAVDGGSVFFASYDGNFYAVDTATGKKKWHFKTGGEKRYAGKHLHGSVPTGETMPDPFDFFLSSPTVSGGVVYFGSGDGNVYALDAASGMLKWKFQTGDVVHASPAIADGTVFIGSWDSYFYAVDAESGMQKWKFEARSRIPSTPAVAGGIVYFGVYSGSFLALDAATGRMLAYDQLVKRDAHDWDVDSPPALVVTRSGRPIVASANKDGLLSILDRSRVNTSAADGDLTSRLRLLSQTATTTRANVNVPLSRDSLTRFCPGIQGGNEWNGAAYSPQTNSVYVGAVDWCMRVRLKRDTTTLPTAGTWLGNENTDTQTPVANARGWVTAFDAENGSVRWKFEAPRPILAGVTPTAGGVVFAADMGGQLYALDAASGQQLWQTTTGQSTGGGIITYAAGGRQLLGVASGMKSSVWPGAAQQSRVIIYGLR